MFLLKSTPTSNGDFPLYNSETYVIARHMKAFNNDSS